MLSTTDFRANGKRYRRTFPTKAEAQRFEHYIKAQAATGQDWNPQARDHRRLHELVEQWQELHGHALAYNRLARLQAIVSAIQNPIAQDVKPYHWQQYQRVRLGNGTSAKTINTELGYIRAVYNQLKQSGVIEYANPLADIQPLRLQERTLTYLTIDQIQEIRHAIQEHSRDSDRLLCIVDVCLSTGARWSEAENIRSNHIKERKVTFANTKNKKTRTIPITEELANQLLSLVPLTPRGTRLESFRRMLEHVSFNLPEGQATHVLRHSFASHFVMNGGNLLSLQRILGHSSIEMTMRYSHLAEDHAIDALKLNPLRSINGHHNCK